MSVSDQRPETSSPGSGIQIEKLSRILEISQQLTSMLELDPLLQKIIDAAAELTETEAASIMLYDEPSGELRFAAAKDLTAEKLAPLRVPIEGSIAGSVFKSGRPMVIAEAASDPRHYDRIDQAIDFRTRMILGVPLSLQDRNIGVLEVINKLKDAQFSEADTQVLSTLAAQAAIAIQNARFVGDLQRAYAKLDALDKVKSDFIAVASHELRTPLGLILGYASMLKDDTSGAAAEQLDVVVQSAIHLRGLIEDMVNVSHLESGRVELDLEPWSLQDLVEAACAECRSLAVAKNQLVSLNLPAGRLQVQADGSKITIVMNNLMTNAIKFTPDGGRILVAAESHHGEIWVSVANTGMGIPAADLERIFERFYQVEPHLTRTHEGMGLGLPIAKAIVELHGGRIWAESVQGKGSCFTFALPVGGPRAAR